MTNTTLREDFEKKFWDFKFHHKELVCFNDHVLRHSIIDFIESKVKEARQEMKKECLECVPKTKMPSMEDKHFDVQYKAVENAIWDCIRTSIQCLK